MRQPFTDLGSAAFIAIALVACRENAGIPPRANHDDTRIPAASQIVDQMVAAYSKCHTYMDTGTVTTVFKSADDFFTEVIQFSTVMARPSQFRFECTDDGVPHSRYVAWRKGAEVRTWWDLTQKAKQEDTLGLALAGATGITGSAHTVPALLMPDEVGPLLLTDFVNATRGDDEDLGNHKCFTIETLDTGDTITFWIDQESFLIRRIDETSAFDDFSTAETTTYDPVIDEGVAPSLLDYNAPE